MNKTLYSGVQMVLGDTDTAFSQKVSRAFFDLGMRDLAICTNGDDLRKAVEGSVDIVLCDIDLLGTDFRVLAQDIRHGRVGNNPFTVLIATSQPADVADIGPVLEAGVDDFIIKPIEAELVVKRVAAFVNKRKQFVVTPSYVGPSRRSARRNDGSDDQLVEVPNTLRAKVVRSHDLADIGKLVETGLSGLSARKAESGIKVVVRLTRRLVQLQADYAMVNESRHILRALESKAGEIDVEHRNLPATRHVAAIAERIARLARRAEMTPIRPETLEIDLLSQLCDAASVAFSSARDAPGTVPEIVKIVDGYLGRR
jgi:response regulator RpfG family c-di-GMP phosphodiesterase